MAARIDPFVDVLLREQGDQLYLLPDEPVTMVKDGKPRKVSRQPLTDQHIYALLVEVAPSESADHIDQMTETEFEYIADRGMVRVRIVPDMGRLTAMVARVENSAATQSPAAGPAPAAQRAPAGAGATAPAAPPPRPPKPSAIAAAPIVVFRVIPAKVVSVEQLGISKEVQQLCYLTKGLVLVTGPTGSGKSTTLCALVDLINRTRTDHIITIEDPIEFVHENKKCVITQRQVGVHTDSFKRALRSALREDPDIVLVGEMRDLETIAIAIETAETGHLVFGTLHTTTASSTVDRIIDQFPADRQAQIRVMLSESLKGVISQTLCKKVKGGRVAAREILLTTPAISNLIREGKTFQVPRRNDIVQLLHANQGIDLGAPAGAAESTSSLLYLQRFQSSEAIVNSVERHADGTAYASYTTPLGPDWYDVARADDAEDTRERVIPAGRGVRRFSDVRAANVNDARWLPPDRAFPPGRGPAPRWVTIHLPLIPRATTPLARSGDYCSRDVVSVLEPLLSLFDPNAGPLARRQAG